MIFQLPGNHMLHLALALHFTDHREKTRVQQFAPLACGKTRPNDQAGLSGFIFQRI